MSESAIAIFADGTSRSVDEPFEPPRRQRAAVLAVPSAWCLCARIALEGLPAKARRQAMLYRLEEKLPLAAEEFSGDFIVNGQAALGVCAQTALLAEPVRVLQERGVEVAAICPMSLLALQHWLADGIRKGRIFPSPRTPGEGQGGGGSQVDTALDNGPRPVRPPEYRGRGKKGVPKLSSTPLDVVAWSEGGGVELVILEAGVLTNWLVLPDEAKDLLLSLRLAAPQSPLTVRTIGLRDELVEALRNAGSFQVDAAPAESMEAHATAIAADILAGRLRPWIDLGRVGLAARDRFRAVRGPLAFAATALAALLICAAGGMGWRAARYDRLAARYADEQHAVYRQAFPNQAAPADVRSRLASEERRLAALSGESAARPADAPGLVVLRDLLAHLPAEEHYRVLEIHLDGAHFTLEGQTASHGSADAIADALRRRRGFAVEPARTEQLAEAAAGEPNAVAFTINGDAIPAGKEAR